jgi:hypothetical protein
MSVPLAIAKTARAAALTASAVSETASITIGMETALAKEFSATAEDIKHGSGRRQLGLRLPCGVELVPPRWQAEGHLPPRPDSAGCPQHRPTEKTQPQRFNRGSDANNNHHVERC